VSLLLLLKGAGKEEAPVTTVPRSTKPPLELDCEIETHDGALYRWDPTSRLASNRPQGLNFQTQRGEGFGPAGAVLTRQVMKDYPDLNLLDTLRFTGKNGEVAYEGQVHDFSRTNDPLQQFAITTIGPMGLAKFRTFREIYIDADLSKWAEPSLQRRINLALASFLLSAAASSAFQDAGANTSGLYFDFSGVTKVAGFNPGNELCYYGGGADLGRLLYDFLGDGSTTWSETPALTSDDLWSVIDAPKNLNGATAAQQEVAATASGRKYAMLQAFYTGASTGQMNNRHAFQNIKVLGTHGLTLQGEWPNVGIPVSEILAHIFNNFTPLTWAGESTTYPAKQAAFLSTFPYDAAKQLNDLHLWELAVFEEKKVLYYPADLTTYDWQVRTDDPGVRFNPLQGDSIDGFANGVEVTYTDYAGRTRTIYPDENAELRDETESNPANLHGIKLWKPFTVPFPCLEADALQIARAYLAEYNRPKSPGTITISGGYIRDDAGHWQQGWKLRCGETIALTNHPNDAPRLITSTPSWNQDAKTLTISIDNGYQLLEAFLARMANGREAANV
jgi:hypothetical protein